jgi:catechol-2,3-dioxygenase
MGKRREVKMSGPPFTARDLGEVAIRCLDLAAMTAFYRDIVGLEVFEGDYSDTIVFLRVAEGFAGHTSVVALFTAADDEEPEGGGTSSLHHLALTVKAEDLAPALAWYRAHGLEPTTAEHRWVGWDSVYVKDPEGNTVELVASVRASSGSGNPSSQQP